MDDKAYSAFRKKLQEQLTGLKMEPQGNPVKSFELYLWSFATVCLSINREEETLYVERYYDSELLDNQFGKNETIPFAESDRAVSLCHSYIRTIRADEPIFGIVENS